MSQLRYANDRDAYAFGPELWTTHDGGATWRRYPVSGPVVGVEISGGRVFVITEHALLRSPSAVDRFMGVRLPRRRGEQFTDVTVHGSGVYVAPRTPEGSSSLLVSSDSGNSFSRRMPGACTSRALSAPASAVVWEFCVGGNFGMPERSLDAGRHFQMDAHGLQIPNYASIAAASAQRALVGGVVLNLTTNGGRSYRRVLGSRGDSWGYVGFTDPAHAFALSQSASRGQSLYRSTDGGATWRRIRF